MPNQLDRTEQLQRLRERYAARNREGKAWMLDEFCEQYRYDRKHAIKLLGDSLPKTSGQSPPEPAPKYQAVADVVEHIWSRAEQLCGKRLAPAQELWLPHYHKHFNPLLPCQKKLLQAISPATIDRLLAHKKSITRGLCGTNQRQRAGNFFRRQTRQLEAGSA